MKDKRPYTLTASESDQLPAQVLAILQQALSEDKRITGHEIAQQLGYRNDRKVRLVIRQLIAEGHPIASSVEPPFGYYLLTDAKSAEAYLAVLRSRALENFSRLKDFQVAVSKTFDVPAQMELFLVEEQ